MLSSNKRSEYSPAASRFGGMCLMLAMVFNVAAQSGPIGNPVVDNKTQAKLTMTANLLRKTYCSASNLRLTISISITNAGQESLIIDRDYFAIAHTLISRDLESVRQGKRELEFSKNVVMQFHQAHEPRPDPELFITLKPNERFTATLNDYIPVYDGKKGHDEFLKPGTYLHQGVLLTWGGPLKLGDELQKKWSQYGILWLEPLTTEPVSFRVDDSPRIEDCSRE